VEPSSAIRLPAGVRDFLPRAAARRRAIAERLLAAFESWGYARIITPVFECADVLERGLGADARAAAIRFVEPGTGEVVALRPDITPQVARIVATRMHDVDGPLRLCYEGSVNRLAGPLGNREILQAGIELIDAEAPDGDAEALAVAAAALATTGLSDVRLDVGHVAPAHFVLTSATDEDVRRRLMLALARKDKAGVARAAAALPRSVASLAEALPTLWGGATDVIERARALSWPRDVRTGLDLLEEVLERAAELVDPDFHPRVTVDLGEVRGFEYYTGIRFAGYAAGAGDAVLRGGRYDELVGRYGRAAHATGFAVDIEAIAQAQRAASVEPPAGLPSVLVMAPRRWRRLAARVAAALRSSGLRAAVDLGGNRSHDQVTAYGRGVGFDHVVELDAAGAAQVRPTDGRPARKVAAAAVRQALVGDAAGLLTALAVPAAPGDHDDSSAP
jgi:ATP phosphoribosyltransferase regulatory subunit